MITELKLKTSEQWAEGTLFRKPMMTISIIGSIEPPQAQTWQESSGNGHFL